MARIVYTWELGEDYGHVGSFMPLALKLRELGHEVVFVVRDLCVGENMAGRLGFHMLQAPLRFPGQVNVSGLPHSYADILLRYGFYDKAGLLGMVRAWCTLFSLLRPDLVIADYSPSALLTARALGLRRAAFGTGFCALPRISPAPKMRHWAEVPQQALVDSERHVLAVANSVLAEMGVQPMEMVADLFEVDANFLCTFAELDHYPDRGDAQYWGPVFNLRQGVEQDWPAGEGKRIFAYIKPQCRDYDKIMTWLGKSGQRVLVFSPGITEQQRKLYRSPSMTIAVHPIHLARIIGDCDLAVCHAGHGTLGAFLLAGVPMLLLPLHVEQALAALRVADLGAGLMVNTEMPPDDYAPVFEALLNNPSYRQKAQAFAAKYASFNQDKLVDNMVARIDEILAQA